MMNIADIPHAKDASKVSKALWDKTHGINNEVNKSLFYIENICRMAEKTKLFATIQGFNSRDNINQYRRLLDMLVNEAEIELQHIKETLKEVEELDVKLHSYENGYVTEISDHPLEYIGKALNCFTTDLDTNDRLI